MSETKIPQKFYIFGAHPRALTLAVYLKKLHPEWDLLGYLYDNDEINPEDVDGVPVLKVQQIQDNSLNLDISASAYIGTRGVNFEHARKVLEKLGFQQIFYYDVALDNELRNLFIPEYYTDHGWDYTRLEDILCNLGGKQAPTSDKSKLNSSTASTIVSAEPASTIYVVRSAADSATCGKTSLSPYESFIQAGCALTGQKLAECRFFDSIGENISDKNRQLCELTAMYWIWKNSDQDIVGLEHYRRRFILPNGWEQALLTGKADIILPVPLYVHPSLKANYCFRHTEHTWNAMMESLAELCPDYVAPAKELFETTACYAPCNLLIANKNVFDDLCGWLFPILLKTMEKCGTLDDNYQNRYPGFLSERLITLYFNYNKNVRVVYADKVFLS